MWKQWFEELKSKASAARPSASETETAGTGRRVEAEGPTWTADFEAQDAEIVERIKKLPPSVGMTLMTAGIVGAVLPGSMGTPLVVAGGMVLAPQLFDKVDGLVKHRFPGLHHQGLKALARFLDDFERRFPPEAAKETDDENSRVADASDESSLVIDVATAEKRT